MAKRSGIADGTAIPSGIQDLWIKEAKEREALKKQRRHDILIASYGIVGGVVSGVASSLIVLWLQGLL